MQVVVLASGSQYRAQLLTRLGIEFIVVSPDIDESAAAMEPAAVLVERLAKGKASKAAAILRQDDHNTAQIANVATPTLIIASDQVACFNDQILGKPGTPENACKQLARMSGQRVKFLTSVHILDRISGENFSAVDTTTVTLRQLDASTIERYVAAEQPLDCAGSFKVESLGISLFTSVSTDDPTALIGLPLIKLCEGLSRFGLQIP